MIIKNKLESIKKIKELNLNKFPEQLFKSNEEVKVKKFITDYPAKYYALRDKSTPNGIFKLKVLKKDIDKEIKDYTLYTINVSSYNYSNNQILVGEIEITSNNEIYAILSKNKEYSVRDAIKNPDVNIKTNIYNKQLINKIPNFDYLYTYICKHNLKDIIIEFSLFNINVGINNEPLIIYELRTHY